MRIYYLLRVDFSLFETLEKNRYSYNDFINIAQTLLESNREILFRIYSHLATVLNRLNTVDG